ncbi:MAG TPA: DUF2917 domain-containing protein [Albitalea sp.]|nr:DUF2917 domain-containing protein [Albitalea sp.]
MQLRQGELLRCDDDTRAVWLSVVSGRVWLTRANDPVDHFLDGGCAMRLSPGDHALASAEGGPADIVLLLAPALPAPRPDHRHDRSTIGALQPAPHRDVACTSSGSRVDGDTRPGRGRTERQQGLQRGATAL